jgi:predicted Rossmann fold nucleotide-binding protein DprA/Smf involved in DNA uptake
LFPWDGRDPMGAAPTRLSCAKRRDPGARRALLGAAAPRARVEPAAACRPRLRSFEPATVPGPLSADQERLLGALRDRPATIDDLGARSGLAAGPLAAALSALELLGLARREPGGRARRIRRA